MEVVLEKVAIGQPCRTLCLFRKTYGPAGAFNTKPFKGARAEVRAIRYDARGGAARDCANGTEDRSVYVTFDDGPPCTPEILDLLL